MSNYPNPKVPGQNSPEPLLSLYADYQPIPKRRLPPLPPEKRIGFAVVGLGILALDYVIPSFADCNYAKLVAIMTGDPEGKGKRVASEYGLKNDSIYGYDEWDRLKMNKEVDVIYVITPNFMHKEHVLQAARIGKHVLCEKAMATNSNDAKEMIKACDEANVKLMIGYRIQFEPHHQALLEIVKNKEFGDLKFIEAHHSQIQDHTNQWRHFIQYAGGGSLWGIGIYCLNFSRFITGEEPQEIKAWKWSPSNDERFKEVESNVAWQMRFPSGAVAKLSSSYDSYSSAPARVYFEKAVVDLDPAFSYWGIKMRIKHRSPTNPEVHLEKSTLLGQKNQFALEIDHMAECVLTNQTPRTSGREGLQDILIMEQIYRSASENTTVSIPQNFDKS